MAIYPIEADKYVVASEFAKRIIQNKATEAEIAYMTKFIDFPLGDVQFDQPEDVAEAQLSVYGLYQTPEGLGMGAIQCSK